MVVEAPVTAPPIGGHRLLGADGTAALLDPDGVVDWWCHPGLDDAPQLWSLLDPAGGTARWWNAVGVRRIGPPAGPTARTVVDVDGELLACWDGLLRIDDQPTLVRLVRSTTKPLGITHELRARGFGGSRATITARSSGSAPPHHVSDSTSTSLEARPDRWEAVVVGRPDVVARAVDVDALVAALEATERRTRELTEAAHVVRAHRDRVEVGLAVVDACTDARTGAVIAAPTTSLPEVPGADRQFDYRYAWLRDASLAAGVAAMVGRLDITQRHLDWLVERCLACEGIPAPVTRTDGEPVPDEVEVPDVAGWGGSRPVRVGNAARDQVQVDGPGEIAEALWTLAACGGRRHPGAYRAVAAIADRLADEGPGPSGGIWELRDPADVANADVGRWLLADRCLRLSRLHQPLAWRRRRRWRRVERDARRRVLGGLLPSGAMPLVYGREEADGAGLLLVAVGLLHGATAHQLVDGTLAELGVGTPVRAVRRYPAGTPDGFRGAEGAFVPVSWWAVSALARLGRVEEAQDLAERLCRALPGLQPEVLDGEEALGNTPLVWSHAEAMRALFLLRRAEVRARWRTPGMVAWQGARAVRARGRFRAAA
jgi:hypothetical protein